MTMSFFAIAFFGASLLFPSYFLQVRGETTLDTGLLLIPQGLGAMLTMPLAGVLTDKIGPGKIVLSGIVTIVIGMSMFTQVDVDTSYTMLLGALFVMGMGMGGTMMPIMTSALQTLKDHEIARGSTLMNITQQVAASIGTALFSVILTNGFNASDAVQALRAALESPQGLGSLKDPTIVPKALADMADSFSHLLHRRRDPGGRLPDPGPAAASPQGDQAGGHRHRRARGDALAFAELHTWAGVRHPPRCANRSAQPQLGVSGSVLSATAGAGLASASAKVAISDLCMPSAFRDHDGAQSPQVPSLGIPSYTQHRPR